jgi:hypothetical protein
MATAAARFHCDVAGCAKSHSLERNLKGNAQRQLLPTPAQRHSPMLTTSQGQTPRMVYACACWRCPTRTEVM